MFDWFNDPTAKAPGIQLPNTRTSSFVGNNAMGGSFVGDPSAWATSGNGGVGIGGTNLPNGGLNNNSGFGFNSNTVGMVIGGIQALGSMWNSYQQQKLAKKSFSLQEEAFRTNLGNQTKSYNTALEDRIRARHFTEGKDSGQTDSYIAKHSL